MGFGLTVFFAAFAGADFLGFTGMAVVCVNL